MSGPGRNDPCPCGSGKKYKKCCLRGEQAARASQRDREQGVRRALEWLDTHQGEQLPEVIQEQFYGGLDPEEVEALENHWDLDLQDMLATNIGEFLLAEARYAVDGENRSAADLLFAPGGPLLPAPSRPWLEQLGSTPLGLYEVVAVRPGEGLQLRDLLRPDDAPLWVVEREASRTLVQWDVVGARLVTEGGERVFSGCLYPLERHQALACGDEIRRNLEDRPLDGEAGTVLSFAAISTFWLDSLLEEDVLPDLVDGETGDEQTPAAPDIPIEEQQRLVSQMLHQHYQRWPDTALPALDGQTPREAVEDTAGRARVVELLKEMEQHEERARAQGGPVTAPYDFRLLWEALELPREG